MELRMEKKKAGKSLILCGAILVDPPLFGIYAGIIFLPQTFFFVKTKNFVCLPNKFLKGKASVSKGGLRS